MSAEDAPYLAKAQEIQASIDQLVGGGIDNIDKLERRQDILFLLIEGWAEKSGPTGLGHVACLVTPGQLPRFSKFGADQRAEMFGMFWYDMPRVAQGAGEGIEVSFDDVHLDAQMQAECPAVRQKVLAGATPDSIDDLYDQIKEKFSSPYPSPAAR